VDRAVLDTNVLVSVTLSKGAPYEVLQHAEDGDFVSVTSPSIIHETRDVLTRDKIPFSESQVDTFIEKILSDSEVIAPEIGLDVVEDDPDDNKIIECAVAGDAEYIISGDSHLLDIGEYDGIMILQPDEFLNRLEG
jgi:putative PIN family toxin of toxin-antitoxin system